MEELKGSEIKSTQKNLSSEHDPGWNDPPKRVFSPSDTSCKTPTKRLLNKRVAFPLNSASNSSNLQNQSPVSLPPNLPPPVSCQGKANSSFPPPDNTIGENVTAEITIDREDSLNETLANLKTVIEKHVQSKNKVQDVEKRIEAMKTMWLDNKLDDHIHRKVLDLSRALKEEDVEKADKIHISLMMERASFCTSWIPGIRHLILEIKSQIVRNNEEIDKSGPNLLSTLSLE